MSTRSDELHIFFWLKVKMKAMAFPHNFLKSIDCKIFVFSHISSHNQQGYDQEIQDEQ